jgi:hypothetical protein
VKVAQIDGAQALIDSGLQAGEQVVVYGQYKLQTGARVVIKTTPLSKAAQLTETDETAPQTQGAGGKQVPAPEGAEHHQRHGVSSEQPAASTAPAMPTQG